MIKLGELLARLYQHITLDAALSHTDVSGITLDSREANNSVVFIAIKGQAVDGRDFIASCGASIIVAQADKESIDYRHDKVIISLVNLPQKVSLLAGRFYGEPSKKIAVTAFTGTNGKTTCAYLYSQLIANLAGTCGHIGTLGYGVFMGEKPGSTIDSTCTRGSAHTGFASPVLKSTGLTTPSPIECQKILNAFCGKTHYASIEASSHALEQHRVKNIYFSGAVFTNLSRDHLDYHKTMSAYFESKLMLFTKHSIDFAVVNLDDKYGVKTLTTLWEAACSTQSTPHKKVKKIGFSLTSKNAETSLIDEAIYVNNVDFSNNGMRVEIAGSYGVHRFFTPLIGTYNLANVLAVIACAVNNGFDIDAVCLAAADLNAVPGRLELVAHADDHASIFVDFAHTPDAVEKVISELRSICKGQLWIVLGCGGNRDKGKRPLMAQVALNADYSVFTSDNPRNESPDDILDDMLKDISVDGPVYRIALREQAIAFAVSHAKQNDIVLIAGKGHEQHQIIMGEHIPFSDVDVARKSVEKKRAAVKQSEAVYVK